MIIRITIGVAALCAAGALSASAGPLTLLNSFKQADAISRPVPGLATSAVSSGINGSVGCVVYTKAEVKQITGRRYRRHIAFMCFSDLGDILGSVVTRKGIPVCTIFGTYDPFSECLLLNGCGFPSVVC